MRFAGTRIEGLLGNDKPDYGQTVSNASTLRSQESQAVTDLMGKTTASGIKAAGDVEAANIVGAAESALASAQGQASIFEGIGQIGGAAIGAMGPADITSYSDIPSGGLRGFKAGGGFSNPNAYFGTGGKYGNYVKPSFLN